MSRYTQQKGEYEYAWGYDTILNEYFYQKQLVQNSSGEDTPSVMTVFSIGSRFTEKDHPDYPGKKSFSNGQLLEIMEKDKGIVPAEHLEKIALDLPF